MARAVEIRSYVLHPGTRPAFDALVREQALPLLHDFGMDVVACGPSPHDADSYYLIRAWRDLAEREASQAAFYGGEAWRQGPREAILALIAQYSSVVLMLDEATIEGLRRA
ncbi:MAG: NIPSNAP family protein [Lysobacteraceae bacterium]